MIVYALLSSALSAAGFFVDAYFGFGLSVWSLAVGSDLTGAAGFASAFAVSFFAFFGAGLSVIRLSAPSTLAGASAAGAASALEAFALAGFADCCWSPMPRILRIVCC